MRGTFSKAMVLIRKYCLNILMIESLHERSVYLLTSLTAEQLQRAFNHPDSGLMTLEKAVALYAWHGKHHLTHFQRLWRNYNYIF
ncbi:DinB family protein [Lysinibacillus sp. NPDC092081]|uniref:DinB family protein n=1 Tax=Lysinibacillus sp. NPDC092081 TaxID=3364131 RepID=UPI00381048AF